MSEPTLGGITAPDLLALCEEAGVRQVTAKFPSLADGPVEPLLRLAAATGAKAAIDELIKRNLLRERP